MESNDEYIPPVKLKKTTNEVREFFFAKSNQLTCVIFKEDHNDLYCFECHDEGDVICCDSCSRVYHPKCLGLLTLPEGDWTCPECKVCFHEFPRFYFGTFRFFKDYRITMSNQ